MDEVPWTAGCTRAVRAEHGSARGSVAPVPAWTGQGTAGWSHYKTWTLTHPCPSLLSAVGGSNGDAPDFWVKGRMEFPSIWAKVWCGPMVIQAHFPASVPSDLPALPLQPLLSVWGSSQLLRCWQSVPCDLMICRIKVQFFILMRFNSMQNCTKFN